MNEKMDGWMAANKTKTEIKIVISYEVWLMMKKVTEINKNKQQNSACNTILNI